MTVEASFAPPLSNELLYCLLRLAPSPGVSALNFTPISINPAVPHHGFCERREGDQAVR